MQGICKEYVKICIKYAQNKQIKYAKIWTNMQIICKNMQKYAAHFVPKKYAKICKNMQIICMLYAKTCKICNHDFYMQNMQKYALPTLLMIQGPGSKIFQYHKYQYLSHNALVGNLPCQWFQVPAWVAVPR
jgi:hypothetical protein